MYGPLPGHPAADRFTEEGNGTDIHRPSQQFFKIVREPAKIKERSSRLQFDKKIVLCRNA
jgi:hypothetical protein